LEGFNQSKLNLSWTAWWW